MIFMLESGQLVTDEDLEFVEDILDVTPHIFFIQTKLDLYDEEDWREVQRLNQEILEEKFEERLAGIQVWPISGTNLFQTATGNGQGTSFIAHHRKLAVALRIFLTGVAGWNRVARAMRVAVRYHAASREVFSGRLDRFAAESQRKRSEMQKVAVEGKRRFEEDWGPRGQECLALRESLQRAIAVGKQSFANTLQMGGDIELAQKAKIDGIRSLADANRLSKEMPEEVVTAATSGWTRVCKEVQHRCDELLRPFGSSVPLDPGTSSSEVADSSLDVKFKTGYFEMLRGAASGIILLTAASVAVAATGAPLPPLGLVAVPILLVLVAGGIRHVRKNQLKSARQELRMYLVEVLQKVRRHFFDVDLISGRFSRMEEYFSALERSVHEQVRVIVEKKSRDVDAELSRLAEAMKLDDRERDLRTRETHERSIEWDSIGKTARDVMALITEQVGNPVALIDVPSHLPLRSLDETPPGSDEKDGTSDAAHHADIRRPVEPEPLPSSPSSPDPAPLDRYNGASAAVPEEEKLDKARADRSSVIAGQPRLSGEQAADRLYAELKRQRHAGATGKRSSHKRLTVQLRWAVVMAALLVTLTWVYWFGITGPGSSH